MIDKNLYSELNISYEDAIRVQWYAIWTAGIPKKGNPNNWFVHHAAEDHDFLSLSYVLHVYHEIKELEKLNCSPFDVNSHALKRLAAKEGFEDVKECLSRLNDTHWIVVNQKVAQSSSDEEYWIAHTKSLKEQLKYIRCHAYGKGYDVSLGALAVTLPFARDRGELIVKGLSNWDKDELYTPNDEELKVAKQFWHRANDELSYNALDRFYSKKFSGTITPIIRNIYDYLA